MATSRLLGGQREKGLSKRLREAIQVASAPVEAGCEALVEVELAARTKAMVNNGISGVGC